MQSKTNLPHPQSGEQFLKGTFHLFWASAVIGRSSHANQTPLSLYTNPSSGLPEAHVCLHAPGSQTADRDPLCSPSAPRPSGHQACAPPGVQRLRVGPGVTKFIIIPGGQARAAAGRCPLRGGGSGLKSTGTGGSNPMIFLKSVRDATRNALITVPHC